MKSIAAVPTTDRAPAVRWWRTDLGELEISGVASAIRDRCINAGPVTRQLETALARLLDVPFVLATSSGSTALLMGLLAVGVGHGDEVLVPAAGFIAPAHAAMILGARVRLVDTCRDRPLLDPRRAEEAVSPRTKAIVPIHLDGAGADMGALVSLAHRRGLHVVEDAARALCSRSRGSWLGTQSDVGAFSMGITKLITTGEGGFVATADEALHDRCLRLRNHGVKAIAENRFPAFGFNLRFTDVGAALGLAQLEQLDERIAAVRRVYDFYREELASLRYLRVLEVRTEDGELPLWTQAVCADRDRVVDMLGRSGIESRPFHPCLAESPHLEAEGDFPNARFFANHGLTLPSGTHQSPDDLRSVVRALRSVGDRIGQDISVIWERETREPRA